MSPVVYSLLEEANAHRQALTVVSFARHANSIAGSNKKGKPW
jgi:hypothetical protein